MDVPFDLLTRLYANNIVESIIKALEQNGVYDKNRPRDSFRKILGLYKIVVRYDEENIVPDYLDAITIVDQGEDDGGTTNAVYVHQRIKAYCEEYADNPYLKITVAHELSHFILGHEPDYSLNSKLGTIERLSHDLKMASNSRVVCDPNSVPKSLLTDEELAEYVAAILLCMPYNSSGDSEAISFFQLWACHEGNLRPLSRYYNVPIDCIIKLAAVRTYNPYKVHYFKWNVGEKKMEDHHIPADRSYDLSVFNPLDADFWRENNDTAVGLCIRDKSDKSLTTSRSNLPKQYHCWAYYEKSNNKQERQDKIYVLGYPVVSGDDAIPSLDTYLAMVKETVPSSDR